MIETLALLTTMLKKQTQLKQNVITCTFSYFRTMARSLNSRCDFKQGFFTCDLPVDVVELILQVKTKHGKHMLKED